MAGAWVLVVEFFVHGLQVCLLSMYNVLGSALGATSSPWRCCSALALTDCGAAESLGGGDHPVTPFILWKILSSLVSITELG